MKEHAQRMAKIAYHALEGKKAEDVKVIEIGDISVIADYFIIVNGNNPSQVEAMVDAVTDGMSAEGVEPKRVEGVRSSGWVLLDYGDIVVHVFSKEDRLFYDLERIWRDGKNVSKEELE